MGAIRSLKGVSDFRAGKSLGRGPMTIPSEHPGYEADSLVERLARVAIVMSGIAVIVLWLYLLW